MAETIQRDDNENKDSIVPDIISENKKRIIVFISLLIMILWPLTYGFNAL
jgi:hypothetical protein